MHPSTRVAAGMRSHLTGGLSAAGLAGLILGLGIGPLKAAAPVLPPIRIDEMNRLPSCVTPERLMAFLVKHNPNLEPRFKTIAALYKHYGEAWRVRWDYAFFQMAIETNFLTYRQPNGRMGDVDPKQNNFAGIGTTGGGVPGDAFSDVKTGVLAQIQHLVVYSGERVVAPVAARTQLKQDDILEASLRLGRPVLFSDLARRWAVDKKYGQSIEWAAESFRSAYCKGAEPKVEHASATSSARDGRSAAAQEVLPWAAKVVAGEKRAREPAKSVSGAAATSLPPVFAKSKTAAPEADGADRPPQIKAEPKPAAQRVRTIWTKDGGAPKAPFEAQAAAGEIEAGGSGALLTDGIAVAAAPAGQPDAAFDPMKNPPAGLGAKPSACKIKTATFGGMKTLLIRTTEPEVTHYTALTVLDGFESSMRDSFLGSTTGEGETLGEYANKDMALAKARELCPSR